MNMEIQPPSATAVPPSGALARRKGFSGLFPQTLKFKGFLFNGLLLLYIVFIVVYALSERNQPLEQLEQYQRIQQAQEALAQADLAAFHIVTVMFSDVRQDELARVLGYFSSLRQQYVNLQQWFPEQASVFRELVDSIPSDNSGTSQDTLTRIQFYLARSKMQLDRLKQLNQQRLADLVEEYGVQSDKTVATILVLGVLGLLLLGGLISLFINRLKRDIQFLQHRTSQIVEGYRGKPLVVHRNDEVGQLTRGVNFMAEALTEREKALEIERNKASFVEKMDAIDSLAGGIAHEVGNPIASIMGLAEMIKADENNKLSVESVQSLDSIFAYSDGLVRLTRELSAFDTHKSDEFDWLDINQLITNTVNIFHLDKRWAGIRIELDLDHSMPAISVSMNQLTQMINNLLENAREALNTIDGPVVTIKTKNQGEDKVLIRVEDNGVGMESTVAEHIFDPFFSTKPVGQGTGLGLSICWTIAKNHNGTIQVASIPGKGSIIDIQLPIKSKNESARVAVNYE